MDGLAPLDAWAIAAIALKSVDYLVLLLAVGGVLFVTTFRAAPRTVRLLACKIAFAAAIISIALLALRFGVRAGRISGMGLPGMADPMMLRLIWESPLGTAALWRAAGALLVLTVLLQSAVANWIALVGAFCIAVSFAFVGHLLGEPRWLLAVLLVTHFLLVALWVGALVPLHRAALHAEGAVLLRHFGRIASVAVPVLMIAGGLSAALLIGSVADVFTTAYGRVLLAKLAAFTGLLSLAALNKWRLVPAIAAENALAQVSLRRSIKLEMAIVILILVATATLTTATIPPVKL